MATQSTDLDFLRRLRDAGVSDYVAVPWMVADRADDKSLSSTVEAKVVACERFAENVIARL